MKKHTIRLIKIITIILFVSFSITQVENIKNLFKPQTAYAVGDLTVDWGIGTGSVGPVFMLQHLVPGSTESRPVSIKNNASVVRSVGIKGIKTSEVGNLANGMHITITKDGVHVYGGTSSTGPKTLSQFFNDSASLNGINLSTQNPSNTALYVFTVTFDTQAGNTYQNLSIQFDLHIGISFAIPETCTQINFAGQDPLYGTQKSDIINGTSGNDLIYALEGSDLVKGNGGNDCIVGGQGSDELRGGDGNDILLGGNGKDAIFGEAGNDKLVGENGSDSLVGGSGNDTLIGGNGKDAANGGRDLDTCNAELRTQCEL